VSRLQTVVEEQYATGKLESWKLLRALKQFKYYIYRVHFLMNIDIKTLVYQLNQLAMDLPSTTIGRYLTYICMFLFNIQHVSSTQHKRPDVLSQRPHTNKERQAHEEQGVRKVEKLERELDAVLGSIVIDYRNEY
jgi:hypothetical protein